jgi:hypothetical protein
VSNGELCRYFLQHLTANCVDILSVISLNFLDMLSAIHGEFSHCVVGCVTVNYVYFVRRFTVNFLGMLSGDSLLVSSLCCRVSGVELSRFFVRLLSVNLLGVLSEQCDMFEHL